MYKVQTHLQGEFVFRYGTFIISCQIFRYNKSFAKISIVSHMPLEKVQNCTGDNLRG